MSNIRRVKLTPDTAASDFVGMRFGRLEPVEIEMPCGHIIHWEGWQDIPREDTPCPCGNPNHWIAKYEDEGGPLAVIPASAESKQDAPAYWRWTFTNPRCPNCGTAIIIPVPQPLEELHGHSARCPSCATELRYVVWAQLAVVEA